MRVGGTIVAPTVDGFVTTQGGNRMTRPAPIVADLPYGDAEPRRAHARRIYASVNAATRRSRIARHRRFTPLDGQITLCA
jgi:hypothetical protein